MALPVEACKCALFLRKFDGGPLGDFRQDQWFANATVSAPALDYDFKRNNLVTGEGPIESDTDGDLLGLSVGGGY